MSRDKCLIVHEHNANECLLYVSGANETMCYDTVCCCSVGGMERNALHAHNNPRADVMGDATCSALWLGSAA